VGYSLERKNTKIEFLSDFVVAESVPTNEGERSEKLV